MAIHTFMTDREFHQSALNSVARIVFDRASDILQCGAPVYDHVKALSVLSNAAVFAGYSNTAINTYYTILDDENVRSYGNEGEEDE